MPSYEFSRGWIYSSVWSRMSSHLWTHETSGEHSRSKPLQRLFLRVPEEASILCFVTISCFSKQKWPESHHVTLMLSSFIYTKMIVIIFGLLKYFTMISAFWCQLITFLCWSGHFLFCVLKSLYEVKFKTQTFPRVEVVGYWWCDSPRESCECRHLGFWEDSQQASALLHYSSIFIVISVQLSLLFLHNFKKFP